MLWNTPMPQPPGDSLGRATAWLAARIEDDLVVLVLGDGMPSSCMSGAPVR
jgi:hypothetical protein